MSVSFFKTHCLQQFCYDNVHPSHNRAQICNPYIVIIVYSEVWQSFQSKRLVLVSPPTLTYTVCDFQEILVRLSGNNLSLPFEGFQIVNQGNGTFHDLPEGSKLNTNHCILPGRVTHKDKVSFLAAPLLFFLAAVVVKRRTRTNWSLFQSNMYLELIVLCVLGQSDKYQMEFPFRISDNATLVNFTCYVLRDIFTW